MKLSKRILILTAGALAIYTFALPLSAAPTKLRYPGNLAWRLITEREIKRITNCPEMPGYEKTHALPLFSQPIAPLSMVQVTPNGQLPLENAPKSWEVAPFPYIAPPDVDSGWQPAIAGTVIEGQAPPSPRVSSEAQPSAEESPDVFSSVIASESPSASLRPRPRTAGEQLLTPADRLPEPFSLRRYSTDEHGFFQISLYSGYSSINAEIAYKTLRTAAPNRQAISGLGSEAFLSLLELPPDPNSEEERNRNETLTPESFNDEEEKSMGFSDIAPEGSKRFDLTDSNFIKAKQAPFFNDIPISAANLTSTLADNLPEALKKTGAQSSEAAAIHEAGTLDFPQAVTGEVPDITVTDSFPRPEAAPAPLAVSADGQTQTTTSDNGGAESVEELYSEASTSFSSSLPKEDESLADPFAERPQFAAKPKKSSGGSILVLIVHYPEKDAVLEVAMDTRMGTLQNLIAMAYLIQGRLLNRW